MIATGDLLFTIDPRPYQIELDREKATLALAQANLSGAKDRLALPQNNIDAKEATFEDATINRDRGIQLLKENVVSQETVDNLQRSFKVAQAELAQSRAAKVVAEQDVAVQNAEVQRVETAVAKAEWELTKTQIKSPARGRVAPFQIRPGTFLEVGKSVLAIVTADNWRIMANLPERHLSRLQIGQPVWVSIGSDPWRIYTGHIFSYAWIIGKLSRRALVRTDAADMLKRRLKQAGLPAHYRVDTPEHYQILLRWLYAAPRIIIPRLGQKVHLPPEPASRLFPSKPDEPTFATETRAATKAVGQFKQERVDERLPEKAHDSLCENERPKRAIRWKDHLGH